MTLKTYELHHHSKHVLFNTLKQLNETAAKAANAKEGIRPFVVFSEELPDKSAKLTIIPNDQFVASPTSNRQNVTSPHGLLRLLAPLGWRSSGKNWSLTDS